LDDVLSILDDDSAILDDAASIIMVVVRNHNEYMIWDTIIVNEIRLNSERRDV
jgi:hypothetical protein